MKVVHVLKQIDIIDQDIKELRKLEKSLAKDKSFTTPIYMSIEKQINLMLGERIKLLELKIENPPEKYVEKIEGKKSVDNANNVNDVDDVDDVEEEKTKANVKIKAKKSTQPKKKSAKKKIIELDDEIPMLTQDDIDAKFEKENKKKTKISANESKNSAIIDDTSVKLLDIALEKGSLDKKVIEVEPEKEKKVRFFRENFPSD